MASNKAIREEKTDAVDSLKSDIEELTSVIAKLGKEVGEPGGERRWKRWKKKCWNGDSSVESNLMLIFNSQYFSKMFISYLYWPYIIHISTSYQCHNVHLPTSTRPSDPPSTDPPNHGRLWPWTRKSHSWRQPWPMPLRCARRQRPKPWEDGRFAVSETALLSFLESDTLMIWRDISLRSWNIHSVDAGCWSCIAESPKFYNIVMISFCCHDPLS